MSEPRAKHVRYDAEKRRWVSEPFTYLPRVTHKPSGRRRLTAEAVLRKESSR